MAHAIMKPDAVSAFCRECGSQRPRWTPSREQWDFRYGLEALVAEHRFPLVGPIVGGVEGCLYGLLPIGQLKHTTSLVIAVPCVMCRGINLDDMDEPPIEPRDVTGPEAWWKKEYDIVRLLTSWVDGFAAFTPKLEKP